MYPLELPVVNEVWMLQKYRAVKVICLCFPPTAMIASSLLVQEEQRQCSSDLLIVIGEGRSVWIALSSVLFSICSPVVSRNYSLYCKIFEISNTGWGERNSHTYFHMHMSRLINLRVVLTAKKNSFGSCHKW